MESKLETLDLYYRRNRQVGHTTAMLNGAKSDPNILVIVGHQAQRNWMDLPKEQMISMNCLDKLKARRNPVLVEHFALQIMFSELQDKLLKLHNELLKKDEKLIKLEKKLLDKNILI